MRARLHRKIMNPMVPMDDRIEALAKFYASKGYKHPITANEVEEYVELDNAGW
jgi:hypothetical protein